VTIDVCPACGYPTVGPDLCSYGRPLGALTGDQNALKHLGASWAASRATIDDFDIVLTPFKAVGLTRRSERP
jgi:hypothetical protein